MLNRRQHSRALLPEALEGTLRLTEDVIVESYGSSEITVVSGVPARSDQQLAITTVGLAPTAPLEVKVTESTPAVVDGVLKHRLRLRVLNRDRIKRAQTSRLAREVSVRLLEMSAGGCLLETSVPISHGTSGELELSFDGDIRSDALRVCRCTLVRGAGSVFRVGAEFAYAPNGRSVRWLATAAAATGRWSVQQAREFVSCSLELGEPGASAQRSRA